MIKLESARIEEFNPDDAIEVWFNKCNRKPGTSKTTDNYADCIEAQIEGESIQEKDDGEIEESGGNKEINIAWMYMMMMLLVVMMKLKVMN